MPELVYISVEFDFHNMLDAYVLQNTFAREHKPFPSIEHRLTFILY